MPGHSSSGIWKWRAIAMPALATALIFVFVLMLDLQTPTGVAAAMGYTAAIACSRWFDDPRASYLLAAIGTALIAIAQFAAMNGNSEDWVGIVNRVMALVTLWVVTALVHGNRMAADQRKRSEVQLNYLARIVRSSSDSIVGTTPEGVIESWNEGAERLFGYTMQEAVGNAVSLIVPDEGMAEEHFVFEQIRLGKFVEPHETRRRRKDGKLIWVSLAVSPIRDAEGRLLGVSKIARDITEIKRVKNVLQQSEERYQLAMAGMSVGLWDWNIVTNGLYLSGQVLKLMGLGGSGLELPRDEFLSRLHPEDRERMSVMINAHLRHEGPYNIEYRLRREDGNYIWIHAAGQAKWDDNGKPLRMVGFLVDITARKNAEEQFRLTTEWAPYAMVMVNRDGIIELANRQADSLFSYDSGELKYRKLEELLPERYRAIHKNYFNGYFDTPSPLHPKVRTMAKGRELSGRRKDGSEFPVEIGLIPVQTDDGLKVLGAIFDLTERKEVEETKRKFSERLEREVAERTAQLSAVNQELEDFVYVASHDLKAPLRVIQNASKWIEEDLEDILTDETRGNITLMRGRARRMEKLLDDLLEYSRVGKKIDERHGEIVFGDVLIANVLSLLDPPKSFTIHVSPAFAEIEIFRMPFQQILLNLIGNAIKHHDQKSGRIDITLQDEGPFHVITVKDDGPGIPARYHNDVFKMFYTLKSRDQVEGSGMGLAIARKQAKSCGGTLDVDSREGRGTAFCLRWPKLTPAARMTA